MLPGWVLLHHSEPVDPALLEWIKGELDHVFGGGTASVMTIIGVFVIVAPLVLSYFAWRRLRRYNGDR